MRSLGLSVAALACLLARPAGAIVPAAAPPSVRVAAAFDGWVRPGEWTEVAVDVESPDGDWEGEVAALAGGVTHRVAVSLSGQRTLRVRLPATGAEGLVEAEGSSPVRVPLRALGPSDLLVVELSDEPSAQGLLANRVSPFGSGNLRLARSSSADLPEGPAAWESVSAVIASRWQPRAVGDAGARELAAWVWRGGLLIVSAQRDSSRLRAPWLDELLPARSGGASGIPLRRALRLHAGEGDSGGGPEPWAANLDPAAGAAVVFAFEGRPLAACRRSGLGAACLVAFDAGDPAVAAHPGWTTLALELIGLYGRPPQERASPSAGQMEPTLEALLNQGMPASNPARRLFLFSLAYAALVVFGPRFYLRRKGREDLAWAGMLAVVAAFSVFAWALAWLGGPKAAARQLAFVHGAPGTPEARLTGFVARFSESRGRWSCALPDGAASIAEVRPQAPAAMRALGSFARRGDAMELLRDPGGAVFSATLHAGQVSYYRYSGARKLGDGLSLRWSSLPYEVVPAVPSLEWENRTGIGFERLWVVGASPASGVAAPDGAKGSLPAPSWRGGLDVSGEPFDAADAQVARAYLSLEQAKCPDCAFVAGVASARPRAGEAETLFVWSVPRPSAEAPRRNILLEGRPGGGASLERSSFRLSAAGPLVFDAPVSSGASSGVRVRLAGTWQSRPTVEVFDRREGRWLAEKPVAPGPGRGETVLPAASHAALAVSPGGAPRVLLAAGGRLLLARLERGAATTTEVSRSLDASPLLALVMDPSDRAHALYRKQGKLAYAFEKAPGEWTRSSIPRSEGATGAAIAFDGRQMNAAFSVPGQGVLHASYGGAGDPRPGGAWSVIQVDQSPSAGPPVVLSAAPGLSPTLLTAGRDVVQSFVLQGSRWSAAAAFSLLRQGGSVALRGASPGPQAIAASFSGGNALVYRPGQPARSIPVALPFEAADAVPAVSPYGEVVVAALSPSGRVATSSQFAGQRWLEEVRDAKRPFDFAASGTDAFFLFSRGGRLVVARREGWLARQEGWPNRSMRGTRDEFVSEFRTAAAVWPQTDLVRVRLEASSPVFAERLVVETLP